METNNREFGQLKNIFVLFLFICCMIFYFIKNMYLGYMLFIVLIILFYGYFYYVYKRIFKRIRDLIKYIDGEYDYIEDNDLSIVYNKVKRLKQDNLKYQQDIENEKKKLKKDIEDICHQMKTPLATLSLYNEMLIKHDHTDYAKKSSHQIERISHFINGLLKLSQVETISFQFDFLPIHYIIDLSLQTTHLLIQSKNIEIHHHVTEIPFYCDEGWLQEGLSNIFKNAIENNCHTISIRYEKHSQYFKVYIHNDGVEIPKKDLPHIFQRFYRSSKSLGNGNGIGLSLTQEIIKRHHGQIVAYNQDGVVFEITFPLYSLSQKYTVTKM